MSELLQQQITQLSDQHGQSPHLILTTAKGNGNGKLCTRRGRSSVESTKLASSRTLHKPEHSGRPCLLLTRWQRWINSTAGKLRGCRYYGSLNTTMYVLALRHSWTVSKSKERSWRNEKILSRPRVNAIARFTEYLRQYKLLLFNLHGWNILVPLRSYLQSIMERKCSLNEPS